MIGGNVTAVIQVKDDGAKNAIGEYEHTWVDVVALKGFLDLSTGDSNRTTYNAKIQESTHIFLCDFKNLTNLETGWLWDPFSFKDGVIKLNKSDDWKWNPFSFISGNLKNYEERKIVDVTSENARMIIQGTVYEIKLIDDPMGMHQHLEIYLKYVGGDM